MTIANMSEITPETLRLACEFLSQKDEALARAYAKIGVPDWRSVPLSYQSLARIIVYQQISTKAAANIWERLLSRYNNAISETIILTETEETLRTCGLSRPKIRHLKSVAQAVDDRSLPLQHLDDLDDQSARTVLLAVKGIGPWTADVFLMGALHRMDVFPVAEVGLLESLRLLEGVQDRLSFKAFGQRAEHWRPYRGMAAHLLWGYLNSKR